MPDVKRVRGNGFRMLPVAAYVTWAAVAWSVWHDAARWPAAWGLSGRTVAVVLLGVFIAAFASITRAAGVRGRRHVATVLMVTALLALLAAGPSGTSPVLLIILAAVLFSGLPSRRASAVLIGVNAAFLLILLLRWEAGNAIVVLAIYGGFQAFASLTVHAAARAEAMADELSAVNARLLATQSLLVESARDGERLRVSRELHDVAGHKLTALKLNLEILSRDPALAPRRELDVARQMAAELLDDVRSVVSQLRSSDGLNLEQALARLIEPVPRPPIHLRVEPDARATDTESAETIVRAAQEGLTNALRHAAADNIWLTLTRRAGELELVIEDDGDYDGTYQPGHGLIGMRERLQAIGGELVAGRGARGGFRLLARMPGTRPGAA